jgi:hypothetical protein
MKFFTKNVKIGLTVLVGLVLLYWGINYLKGINLLTPANYFTPKSRAPMDCLRLLPSRSTVSRWDR